MYFILALDYIIKKKCSIETNKGCLKLLLNRIEKKKYKEIAQELGITVKAVEKRMHQALKVMREKIGKV